MAAGIVVAAGAGERLGSEVPKAFVDVAGAPLVAHAVAGLRAADVTPVVVVVPPGWEDRARQELGCGPETATTVVAGGATRTASVAAGLAALPAGIDVVAVHDAARPLMPVEAIADAVAAVRDDVVASAPGLPVADTVKQVDEHRVVLATVDRTDLVGVQTPQVFRRGVLETAHAAARADGAATDDLGLVERLVAAGDVEGRVVVTDGSAMGLKVTQPADLLLVTALLTLRRTLDDSVAT